MKKAKFSIFALMILIGFFGVRLYAQSYKIIVHASNPISSMTKDDVSRIFLKKNTEFNGTTALPVDLVSDNPVRHSFSSYIHGKSVAAVKAYWQQQIFSGRGVPPPEKSSDRGVIAYVWANPGAIGYVSASTPTEGVKIIVITD